MAQNNGLLWFQGRPAPAHACARGHVAASSTPTPPELTALSKAGTQ